jgi:hypothetical protein
MEVRDDEWLERYRVLVGVGRMSGLEPECARDAANTIVAIERAKEVGEYRRYDGELDLAFKRIAESRKQMEEAKFVAGLLDLQRRLGIMSHTVSESIDRARESYGQGN